MSELRGRSPCAPKTKPLLFKPSSPGHHQHHRSRTDRITGCTTQNPSPLHLRKQNAAPAPAPRRRRLGAPPPLPLHGGLAPSLGHGLQQGGAGRVAGRARLLRPRRSQISVPAHLANGMDFAAASVRATSSDGLLLLDLAETRHCPAVSPHFLESLDRAQVQYLAAAVAANELDVTRFVCNPLSGQLFRLPVPDMDAAHTSTAFGLLTQSGSSHGPPDRYVVAQLSFRARDNRLVVRRFLSETGEWDERLPMPCFVPSTFRMPRWQPIQVHTSHNVLAFGDRLWWFDVTWGAFSVDPFSDLSEIRFVELPPHSVLSDIEMKDKALLGKRRLMGVSEGKLWYVELCAEKEPFMLRSFSLDDEGCYWKLTREETITVVLPNKAKPQADHLPWLVAIDPFNANILYFDLGHTTFAMERAKSQATASRSCPDSITGRSTGFFLPCVLPAWLESSCIPSAGTLSSKKTNAGRKTLADMVVRADRD